MTKYSLEAKATFEGDGRNFVLHESPVTDAPTGRYYFKSQPLENAHQYRYASSLAQHLVETAKARDTPPRELTFSLGKSERVSAAVKALEGAGGELTVSLTTFTMKARDEDVSESYMLAGALVDSGTVNVSGWLDDEYATDILDLACIGVSNEAVAIDESRFAPYLDTRRAELEKEVQGRNSRYYDQQEELLYRNRQDRKAEHEAAIRDYRSKEKEARKAARQAENPMEQLRLKKEARKWEQKTEDADEAFRDIRKKLREEAGKYLDLIEQSLRGIQATEHLFTIRWRIEA